MTLIVETGSANRNANTFVTLERARKYYGDTWGYEALSSGADCLIKDDELARALKAAFSYMVTIPWAGCPAREAQPGAWPRVLYEHDYHHYYGSSSRKGYHHHGGFLTYYQSSEFCVSACEIPERIIEAQMRLARDIIDGVIDPTGRERPVIATSVSSEAGSISFHRPQALRQTATGMKTQSRDPLYAVRELLKPWLRVRVQSVRLRRG